MSKEDFSKPPISLFAQLELLQQRGLIVDEVASAEHRLLHVGYYRFSGYIRYYADPADEKFERIRKGTTFEQVYDVYTFDRRLRSLLLKALERIEVAVKANLSHEAATSHGAFWLCDSDNFDHGSHEYVMEKLDECIGDTDKAHQHIFINHFRHKYSNNYPPCWMMMELFSFGTISKFYKITKGTIRQKVSAKFDLQHDILESWLHSLAFARNVCAHHNRVWNRSFTIKPKIPKIYRSDWPSESQDRLYSICVMIWHLLKRIDPASPWAERLIHLIDNKPAIPLRSLGFPTDWKDRSPWR